MRGATGVPARSTTLTVVTAALACLAAVVLAGWLGPVTFSGDSALDRLRIGDADADEEAVAEDPADEALVDVPETDAGEGVPLEVVLSIALTIVAGAFLVRSLLAARREEATDGGPVDDDLEDAVDGEEAGDVDLVALAAAARRGLERIDDPAPPEGAADLVVGCWVGLEQAGGALGRPRVPTDTPTDFARRLAAAVPGLDADTLDGLRRTYARVRFGDGEAGPDDVATARAALAELLRVLDRAAPVGNAP